MCRLLYNATYKKNLRKFSGDGKSVFQSVSLSVCMPVCLSLSELVSRSVRMSAYLSVCLSDIHSVCLSACLSVSLSVCLSLGLSGQLLLDRSAYYVYIPHCLKISLFSFARSSSSPFFISRSLTIRKMSTQFFVG